MDGVHLGADFLQDMEVIRYSTKRKSEITLSFTHETYEIICKNGKTGKVDLNVSLFEVKEIRPSKTIKNFERWAAETKKIENARCFSLLYGTDFRLKTLSVAAPTKKEAESWIKGLEYLIDKRPTSYLAKLDTWFAKQYNSMIAPTALSSLTLKQLKDFTSRISMKTSTGTLREMYQHQQNNDGNLDFVGFKKLMIDFLHDQQIFTDCFGRYSYDPKGGRIDFPGFEEFLKREQNEESVTNYKQFFRQFANSGGKGRAFMSSSEAVDLLFSKQNQVWNTKYDKVYQDMTRPLSHYWIASSHNTYLTGDQVSSESSVDAYARCLRQGCRCLEIDVWDGPNGTPIIYHGRTLTTKICFVETLKTIRDHAFVTSEYPVILSLENHCCGAQQKVMTKKFHEIFGSMLVSKPFDKDETELPSPNDLRKRILLKGKKLPRVATESIETEKETDLSATYKTGKMYIQEGNMWAPYFFALTHEKLIYTELMEDNRNSLDNGDQIMPIEELHYSKIWFHGKIPGGVKSAEERVKQFGVEGGFLVRQSETLVGEYSLCFLSQGHAHNIRIKSNPEQSQYYLIPSKPFDSLYSLISYYRKNPLETRDFRIDNFTAPVPEPETPEQFLWFYPNTKYPDPMDREKAEQMLRKIPLNGAFLVRYSGEYLEGKKCDRFVITFRMENKIRHCRVKQDGRLLVVSNQRFESIDKLVQHYSVHIFYHGLKLKHAVNEELYKFAHSVDMPEDEKVYTSPDYLDTNNQTCNQVRALSNYDSTDPDLLTYKRGDIITNVVKNDSVWWKGDLDDQKQKSFMVNFVEELEPVDSPFGELQKGSVALGKVDIEPGNDEFPYVLKVNTPNTHVSFKCAVQHLKIAKEWQEMINAVYNRKTTKRISFVKSFGLSTKKHKSAPELSKLIVYCGTVSKLNPDDVKTNGRMYNQMTSYTEVIAEKQMSLDPEFYVWLHEVQLSRVYPKAQRVDSSNYNPIRYWNFGCQMIALNYQTSDRAMQLNHGKFRQNGKCGYVLRPEFMFKKNFHPFRVRDLDTNEIEPFTFKIKVIAARLLSRSDNKSISNPFVEVEIIGSDFDCQKVRTTKFIVDNGFNPFWNENFVLKVLNPDLALIRFSVSDEDSFGDSHFLGQATYPAKCLLQGYRSVPLENGYGEELISSMLIHIRREYELFSVRKN